MCGSGQSKVKNPVEVQNINPDPAGKIKNDEYSRPGKKPAIVNNLALKGIENNRNTHPRPRIREEDLRPPSRATLERHFNPRKDDVGPIRAPEPNDDLDYFVRKFSKVEGNQVDKMSKKF